MSSLTIPVGATITGIQYDYNVNAVPQTPIDVERYLIDKAWVHQFNGMWVPPHAYNAVLMFGEYTWAEAVTYEMFRGLTLHEYDPK